MNEDEKGNKIANEKDHEWSAFHDEEGRVYYYNKETGESSWDAPENYDPAEDQHDTAVDGPVELSGASTVKESASESQNESQPTWAAYHDDDGREYYYNNTTGETTWDKPENFDGPSGTTESEANPPSSGSEMPSIQADARTEHESSISLEDTAAEHAQEGEAVDLSAKVDPEKLRLEAAVSSLARTDAILEPGVLSHVTTVVRNEDGNPQNAIQALSESYFGQTAICGLLGKWLVDLKAQSSVPEVDEKKSFIASSQFVRRMVQDVVIRITGERFTKTGGDSILDLSKSEATFLSTMMDSDRWRSLLIDLSASNKESALLMYCLEQISKRGHHREIARRINQSDHFAVFNAMLSAELTAIGRIAVSQCKEDNTSIALVELVGDLLRACSSTGYTYIYATELLRSIVTHAKQRANSKCGGSQELYWRATRKWERLVEELHSNMVNPSSSTSTSGLYRKRRLDVAATVSELHQRQRRRIEKSEGLSQTIEASNDGLRSRVESAVLNFLRRFSLGTKLDDSVLDLMGPTSAGITARMTVGKILLDRPVAIQALLGYLYKPGSQRVVSVVSRNKCAELISWAVYAAKLDVRAEPKQTDASETPELDTLALSRVLVEGSNICESLENTVSFVVRGVPSAPAKEETNGERLFALAAQNPAVARGVAIWARELTQGDDYLQSASYATLSPSILSLIRLVYLKQPFICDDAMEVAMTFLGHSSSEVSYQKMNEIKEQSIRLLLYLAVQGEAPAVLREMTDLLRKSSSAGLDASLVRFFVANLLEVAVPPYSVPFVRALCSFLVAPGTTDALNTKYFEGACKDKLNEFFAYLQDLLENQKRGQVSGQDIALIKSAISIYTS